MQLFVGRIPNSVRYDELYEYFSKFGKVRELRLKESYGFLEFEIDSVATKVLEEKHMIGDFEIHVEVASDNRRGGSFRSRTPPYRSRSPDYRTRRPRYHSRSPERRRRERSRSPSYMSEWSQRRYRSSGFERRSPCDYCDRCEKHGRYRRRYRDELFKRGKRSFDYSRHPNNRLKIVLDNIGEGVRQQDLVDLARRYDFEPTFTRITSNGKHGIIEFSTTDEREDALGKLDGVELLGQIVAARPYFQREGGFGRETRPKRQHVGEAATQTNNIYDDIRTESEWTKTQKEPEWKGDEGDWTEGKAENKQEE